MCSCKPSVSLLLPLTPTGPSGSASQLTSPSASASRPSSPLPLSPGSPAAADSFLRSCGRRAFTHPDCPPPGVSGPRSPGRSPEIAHCQIRSSVSSSVGASSPSPALCLPSILLPAILPCTVPRAADSPNDNWPRKGRGCLGPRSLLGALLPFAGSGPGCSSGGVA